MRRLGRILIGIFATIGVLVVLAVCAGIGFALIASSRGPKVADNTILTLDLTQSFPDRAPESGVQRLIFPGRMTLIDALGTIARAGDDPRVTGLVARIGDSDMQMAQVQELRQAIATFRAKGKRAVAYTDTFGELSSGTRSYYLAAAFDQIWLQQMGMVALVGLRLELPYLRGTLDKLGIVPRFEHREEYKDAANVLTETAMPAPEREELQRLLDSITGKLVEDIARDRKIDAAAVRQLIDRAPLATAEAKNAHLVDAIGDRADAIGAFGATPHLVSLGGYRDQAGAAHRSGPTVALIYASGLIARGGGGSGSPLSDDTSGTDRLVRAFRLAQEDKDVRAILFRVDSPGGSAIASETIWEAVKRARDAGKPIIVSMGDVAGSGGYYIAAPADKIVAEPGTLTGSIGVVGGKLVFRGLLEKLGGNFDFVQSGANSGIFSILKDFSPAELAQLNAALDDIYSGFKRRVAEGRKLSDDAVEAVAKGRVWSGADAQQNHLVDALGGFETALDLAKQAAGIATGDDVTLKLYPARRGGITALIAQLIGDDEQPSTALPAEWLALGKSALKELQLLAAPPGALTMAPIQLR